MENLKIKVNNEAESKEIQELFVVLGAVCCSGLERSKNVNFLFMNSGFVTACKLQENFDKSKCKEITLPDLRDLVVLKRNDAWDANYTYCGKPVLKLETQDYKVWNKLDKCWVEHIGSQTDLRTGLKPIEKPMKEPKQAEFLVKTDSGYVLQVLDENSGGADVVRVPDGADTFAGDDNCHYFWQHRSGKKHLLIGCGSSLERYPQWVECEDSADEWLSNFDGDNSLRILWQREISAEEFKSKLPESTFKDFKQPEDLPFLDNGVDIGVENLPDFTPEFPSEKEIKTDFPLNRGDVNYRVAKAFNEIRGTDLTEDDLDFIRKLIDLTVSHYGG